jgi:hypothetical protein
VKSTDDIVRIVSHGAGVIIDGSSKSTDDLVKIVSQASKDNSPVIIRNTDSKSTDGLVRIAAYGMGRVILEL